MQQRRGQRLPKLGEHTSFSLWVSYTHIDSDHAITSNFNRVKGLEIQVQEMRGLLANKGDEIVATREKSVKLAQM